MSKFVKCEKIAKVDESLGLVFGWGIVCKRNGEDYYDTQGDHIPEESMLEAVTDFAKTAQTAGDMHIFEDGTVTHEFPMTEEIAVSLGLSTNGNTGWLVGVSPSPEVLAKFVSGERTGFSIGGSRIEEEVIE